MTHSPDSDNFFEEDEFNLNDDELTERYIKHGLPDIYEREAFDLEDYMNSFYDDLCEPAQCPLEDIGEDIPDFDKELSESKSVTINAISKNTVRRTTEILPDDKGQNP